jgi:ankyrin repeat protein
MATEYEGFNRGSTDLASSTKWGGSGDLQDMIDETIRDGDISRLEKLLDELKKDKLDVNCYDPRDGQTALHRCCLVGNLDLVRLLDRYGADVRLTNRDGWNALHIAAWKGHRDMFNFLIGEYRR